MGVKSRKSGLPKQLMGVTQDHVTSTEKGVQRNKNSANTVSAPAEAVQGKLS
jgi:hypothetical protein